MKEGKTTIIRFKPISKITDDEMRDDVVSCDGTYFLRGRINADKEYGFLCKDEFGRFLPNVTHFAVLPKDE